jgi:anti-anti-sigma factor
MQLLAQPHEATLTIRVAERQDTYVIALHGELDCAHVARLRRALRRAERTAARCIVVDLSALTFMDSSGLAELLAAQRRSSSGDRLELLRGTRSVQRVFEITNVTDLFRFVG